MPHSTEVGHGRSDIVLDGDPAPSTERDTEAPTFSAHDLLCRGRGFCAVVDDYI